VSDVEMLQHVHTVDHCSTG